MIMYVRQEHIEEENLDWGELAKASVVKQNNALEETKEGDVKSSVSKQKKPFLNNRAKMGRKFNIKNELNDLLKQNAEISLLLGIVLVPYILGFAISYFLFFFYGGVSIVSFLSIPQAPSAIELWSIGAYLFITVGAVLAFFVP